MENDLDLRLCHAYVKKGIERKGNVGNADWLLVISPSSQIFLPDRTTPDCDFVHSGLSIRIAAAIF